MRGRTGHDLLLSIIRVMECGWGIEMVINLSKWLIMRSCDQLDQGQKVRWWPRESLLLLLLRMRDNMSWGAKCSILREEAGCYMIIMNWYCSANTHPWLAVISTVKHCDCHVFDVPRWSTVCNKNKDKVNASTNVFFNEWNFSCYVNTMSKRKTCTTVMSIM